VKLGQRVLLVEFIQAAEMSLRAFDKSGSGRRTGSV
jgi:hypothetical protein